MEYVFFLVSGKYIWWFHNISVVSPEIDFCIYLFRKVSTLICSFWIKESFCFQIIFWIKNHTMFLALSVCYDDIILIKWINLRGLLYNQIFCRSFILSVPETIKRFHASKNISKTWTTTPLIILKRITPILFQIRLYNYNFTTFVTAIFVKKKTVIGYLLYDNYTLSVRLEGLLKLSWELE